ncbi:MAG: hypothetical protein KKD31_05695 [Bacteroidetes bacterium]|nr:hypothetical protein [Bacteroidota bacterium]
MQLESIQKSIITTSSGVVGGVTKAVTSGFTLASVSILQMLDVSVYAAISAMVGYAVKSVFDTIKNRKARRKSK